MSSRYHPPRPILRVRTGCFTCRSRKKKCDEVKPVCAGCKRNKLGCRWPTAAQIQHKPADEVPRRHHETIGGHRRNHDGCAGGLDYLFPDIDCPSPNGSAASAQAQSPPSRSTSSSPSSSSSSRLSKGGSDSILNQLEPDAILFSNNDFIDASFDAAEDSTQLNGTRMDLVRTPAPFASGFDSVPTSLAILPGLEGPSFELLGHYLSRTALSMGNGSTDVNPFISQLVPLCFANSFILELVLCQSANHRASEDTSKLTVAQRYYSKSLQLFRSSIDDYVNGKEGSPLWIAIGALIMCFTETAKGDVNGIIFDHINAAGPLLAGLVTRTDLIRSDLKDFMVEYYAYTATISMISVDPAFSSSHFLSADLELQARELVGRGYVGQLVGCWLELLLLIPQIFEFGRRSRQPNEEGTFPEPDDLLAFSALQAQILAFNPPPLLGYELELCGQVYKNAMHIYLLTSLDVGKGSKEQLRQAIRNAMEEAFLSLDQLPSTARINTSLSWALAVIGTCLGDDDYEQREKLRSRLQMMFLTIGLGNIRATLTLLEKIWEYPAAERSPWIICKAMQDHETWISFV